MTVVNKQYFEEIIVKLQKNNVELHHYALIASKDTLLKRLKSRGASKHSWAAQQIERCVSALSDPSFSDHIQTDQLSPDDILSIIATKSQLKLVDDRRHMIKKIIDRLVTRLK